MAKANFDGTADVPRHKLTNKARYPAELKQAELRSVTTFDGQDVENKIALTWSINVDGEKKELLQWFNPAITKGSGKYSNSNLYDFLDTVAKIEDAKKLFENSREIPDEMLTDFMNKFVGMKVEVEIKNIRKGTLEEYSTVGDVIKAL